MEKEIIPYNEALILRELGFSENCFGFFNVNGTFIPDYYISFDATEKLGLKGTCLAPTYSQVFRWFRDVHQIDGWVVPYHSLDGKKYCILSEFIFQFDLEDTHDFDNYEEAQLNLLKTLLKVIKARNYEPEHTT